MFRRAQILIDNRLPLIRTIRRSGADHLFHSLYGIEIDPEQITSFIFFNKRNGVSNQLGYFIVVTEFSRPVGHPSIEGFIAPYMPTHIDNSSCIGIIVFLGYVFLVYPLVYRLFQIQWKQVDEKIKYAVFVYRVLQIEQIDFGHLLKHVVQKVVFTLPLCKP